MHTAFTAGGDDTSCICLLCLEPPRGGHRVAVVFQPIFQDRVQLLSTQALILKAVQTYRLSACRIGLLPENKDGIPTITFEAEFSPIALLGPLRAQRQSRDGGGGPGVVGSPSLWESLVSSAPTGGPHLDSRPVRRICPQPERHQPRAPAKALAP